jgi:hypothetical protein
VTRAVAVPSGPGISCHPLPVFGWGAPSGTDQVKIEYNLDGTVDKKTFQRHQAGDDRTVISYVYDGTFRRLVRQSVDPVGTGVDDAVRSITYAYDWQGRMGSAKSCANADGGGVRRCKGRCSCLGRPPGPPTNAGPEPQYDMPAGFAVQSSPRTWGVRGPSQQRPS